jgi:branched-subunit amino acid ABC-type transport system permease component
MLIIIIAHRILIVAAICFGVFYTIWEALAYRETREANHLVIAVIALIITLGLAYYLKNLRRFVGGVRP